MFPTRAKMFPPQIRWRKTRMRVKVRTLPRCLRVRRKSWRRRTNKKMHWPLLVLQIILRQLLSRNLSRVQIFKRRKRHLMSLKQRLMRHKAPCKNSQLKSKRLKMLHMLILFKARISPRSQRLKQSLSRNVRKRKEAINPLKLNHLRIKCHQWMKTQTHHKIGARVKTTRKVSRNRRLRLWKSQLSLLTQLQSFKN